MLGGQHQREQHLPDVVLGDRPERSRHSLWTIRPHLFAESGENGQRLLNGLCDSFLFVSHICLWHFIRMGRELLQPAASRAGAVSWDSPPGTPLTLSRPTALGLSADHRPSARCRLGLVLLRDANLQVLQGLLPCDLEGDASFTTEMPVGL